MNTKLPTVLMIGLLLSAIMTHAQSIDISSLSALAKSNFLTIFSQNLSSATYTQYKQELNKYLSENASTIGTGINDQATAAAQFTVTYVWQHPELVDTLQKALSSALANTNQPDLLQNINSSTNQQLIDLLKQEIEDTNLTEEEKEKAKTQIDQLVSQMEEISKNLEDVKTQLASLPDQAKDAIKPLVNILTIIAVLLGILILAVLMGGK
ncbi:MAG: hypothetical protein ACOY3I_02930 [Verrucomicrobiota bacterium]